MPIMSGFEANKEIKQLYEKANKDVQKGESGGSSTCLKIIRPVTCFVSQFERKPMTSFIAEDEQADCYLEKPLPA